MWRHTTKKSAYLAKCLGTPLVKSEIILKRKIFHALRIVNITVHVARTLYCVLCNMDVHTICCTLGGLKMVNLNQVINDLSGFEIKSIVIIISLVINVLILKII